MIRIQKLTPVQITALRNACPGLTGAGMLTTTASIAEFRSASTADRKAYPTLDFDMTVSKVEQIVSAAHARTAAKPLEKVLAKLATGKDVTIGDPMTSTPVAA